MIEDLYSPNSDSVGSIAAALSKAQANIQHAVKSSTNPQTRSKYADLTGILDTARQPLAENELAVIHSPYALPDGVNVLVTTVMHSSGEWVRSVTPVNPRVKISGGGGAVMAVDDMQTIGAAITYARRYALAAMLGIGQEDDDGNAASGRGRSERAVKPSAPRERTDTPAKPQAAGNGGLASDAQLKALAVAVKEYGFTKRDETIAFFTWLYGRPLTSSKELTKAEASRVLGWSEDQWEAAKVDFQRRDLPTDADTLVMGDEE